jgi:hypothetical protein
MQTTEKQREDSGKAQIALLVVLGLAAGGAGVWSELQAASGTPVRGTQIDVAYGTDTNSIYGSVSPNGDGTANVSVFQAAFQIFKGPGFIAQQTFNFLSAGDPANTTYSQTVNIKPGMSGKQTGSGTASATVPGFILDFSTFTMTPVLASLQMAVDNADQASAFNNHTLNVGMDPVTGKVTASRVVSSGVAALGPTAGSISISVDGEVYASAAGAIGQVQAFSNHSVTQIQ